MVVILPLWSDPVQENGADFKSLIFIYLFIYFNTRVVFSRTSSLSPTPTTSCPAPTPDPTCSTRWSTPSSGGGGRSRSRGSPCSTATSSSANPPRRWGKKKASASDGTFRFTLFLRLRLVSHRRRSVAAVTFQTSAVGGDSWSNI